MDYAIPTSNRFPGHDSVAPVDMVLASDGSILNQPADRGPADLVTNSYLAPMVHPRTVGVGNCTGLWVSEQAASNPAPLSGSSTASYPYYEAPQIHPSSVPVPGITEFQDGETRGNHFERDMLDLLGSNMISLSRQPHWAVAGRRARRHTVQRRAENAYRNKVLRTGGLLREAIVDALDLMSQKELAGLNLTQIDVKISKHLVNDAAEKLVRGIVVPYLRRLRQSEAARSGCGRLGHSLTHSASTMHKIPWASQTVEVEGSMGI